MCAQHIEHLSRATCHVTCHVARRDSSAIKFDRVELTWKRIYLSSIFLAEPLIDEGGEKTAVPRENPWQQASENATCILKPEDSNPRQDSNPHHSLDGRLRKQTCSPLHHASLSLSYCIYICTFRWRTLAKPGCQHILSIDKTEKL